MKTIPPKINDLLKPSKDYSYVEYLGSKDGVEYFILSYYEPVSVGYPSVASWYKGKAQIVETDKAFNLIQSFIKD